MSTRKVSFSAVDQKNEVGSIEVLIPGNSFELRLDQQLIQKTRLWFKCRLKFRFEKKIHRNFQPIKAQMTDG